jgi:hypothetical protein
MPRYFFHVKDGATTLDDEGVEIASIERLQKAAVSFAGELLRDSHSNSLWSGSPWELWITDQPHGRGNRVLNLVFSAALSSKAAQRGHSADERAANESTSQATRLE